MAPLHFRAFGTLLGILGMAGTAPVGRSSPCRLARDLKGAGAGAGAFWIGRLQVLKAQGQHRPDGHPPSPRPGHLEGNIPQTGVPQPESFPSTCPFGCAHAQEGAVALPGTQAHRGSTETQTEKIADTGPAPGSARQAGTFH